MKYTLTKICILALALIASSVSVAATQNYQCPALQGTYHNDQSIGDWFFWTDKSVQSVDLKEWPGQKVNERAGKYYNFGLVCHAGGLGPYYGVMLPVKAKRCTATGNGAFRCE